MDLPRSRFIPAIVPFHVQPVRQRVAVYAPENSVRLATALDEGKQSQRISESGRPLSYGLFARLHTLTVQHPRPTCWRPNVVVRVLGLSSQKSGRMGRPEGLHGPALQTSAVARNHRSVLHPETRKSAWHARSWPAPDCGVDFCLEPWSQFFPMGENWRNCGRLSVRDIWPRHLQAPAPTRSLSTRLQLCHAFFRNGQPG